MKKILVFLIVFAGFLFGATQSRPTPPAPSIGGNANSCKVPEFLVNIPPVMEDDYTTCVNNRFKPSKALIEVVLKQQVSKKAEFIKIEPAPRFYTKVYKVTYKIGSSVESMICNEKMTYCLKDKPIVSRKR